MLEKYDCACGVTTGASEKGTFVDLDNGAQGWIVGKYIPRCTKVRCTVFDVKENGFAMLMLDSIKYPDAA